MLGSALILGGLLTSFVDLWLVTAICASLFCALYAGIGRKHIKAYKEDFDSTAAREFRARSGDLLSGTYIIVKRSLDSGHE